MSWLPSSPIWMLGLALKPPSEKVGKPPYRLHRAEQLGEARRAAVLRQGRARIAGTDIGGVDQLHVRRHRLQILEAERVGNSDVLGGDVVVDGDGRHGHRAARHLQDDVRIDVLVRIRGGAVDLDHRRRDRFEHGRLG
jgi:hypothetical protein